MAAVARTGSRTVTATTTAPATSADSPDAVVTSTPPVLAGLVYDGHDLAEALRIGAVKVQGDQAAVERFLTLFALPEKASASAEP